MSLLVSVALAVITIVQLLLLARVVSSWVLVLAGTGGQHLGLRHVDAVLGRMTDPVLRPVRRVVPPLRLGSVALDISVPIVLLGLSLVGGVLSTL